MLKLFKKINIVVIAFILLLPFFEFSSLAGATEYKAIRLHFLDPTKDEMKGRIDLEIFVWKISDIKETDDNIIKKFDKLTDEQVEQRLGKEIARYITDKEGKIVLENFTEGKYYIREKEYEKNKAFYSVPLILEIPNSNEDIFIKTVTNLEEDSSGGYNFRKVASGTNNPLENASFRVTRKNNEVYEPVLRDGRVYIVSSDNHGFFKVDNLEYGDYYLWEIDAPTGYIPLKDPIKFEVTKFSLNEEEKIIKNDPFNPPRIIVIPNTGDMLFAVLLFGGIIIFSLGYKMTKEEN